MNLEIGSVVTGKVTGIAKFGAFVSLPGGKAGLIHISEVTNSYITNVEEHLKVGQEVRVKILSIDDKGRINLSAKQAASSPRRDARAAQNPRAETPENIRTASAPQEEVLPKSDNRRFEDTLKKFLQDADSKISESRIYDRQRSARRKGGRR